MLDQFFSTLFTNDNQLRHFSRARHSLVEAFRLLRLKPGDKVLLPEYICRDLLASLCALELEPVWYPVTHNLRPSLESDDWPMAKVVLAVNYFGFAQDLTPFNAYAKRAGAFVIEDNAHGFLSRDLQGRLLGTRADLGLFSYRKTFLLGRGAGLCINRKDLKKQASNQLPFTSLPIPREIKVRRQLRQVFGTRMPAYLLSKLIRLARKARGKSEIPAAAENAERVIPTIANPDHFLLQVLNKESVQRECQRRRSLYKRLAVRAKEAGLTSVYAELPDNTVPYGIALFGSNVELIAKLAEQERLDYFKWPDLPRAVMPKAPQHYSNIYLINFL